MTAIKVGSLPPTFDDEQLDALADELRRLGTATVEAGRVAHEAKVGVEAAELGERDRHAAAIRERKTFKPSDAIAKAELAVVEADRDEAAHKQALTEAGEALRNALAARVDEVCAKWAVRADALAGEFGDIVAQLTEKHREVQAAKAMVGWFKQLDDYRTQERGGPVYNPIAYFSRANGIVRPNGEIYPVQSLLDVLAELANPPEPPPKREAQPLLAVTR